MAKITNQEHQYNVDLDATEVIAIYINGTKAKEYTVGTGNQGKVTFMYQEQVIPT
jgi:hypothetical protein